MLFEFESSINNYNNNSIELFDITEGLEKGNMFINLYDGYKNYKPCKLKAKNAKEEALLNIMMLDFAINDLNLYLDIHPEDSRYYELFRDFAINYKTKLLDYEKKYQVLCLTDDVFGKYTWIDRPWPWEDKNV